MKWGEWFDYVSFRSGRAVSRIHDGAKATVTLREAKSLSHPVDAESVTAGETAPFPPQEQQ